ncbi:receptor [Branchiostoma belcheri]|nr:receptor [Branchiostoma belcheri]
MSGLFENGSLFGIGDVLPTELVPDTSTEAYNYNASGKDELTGNLSLSTSGTTAAVGAPDLGPEAIVVPTVFAIICAIGIAGNALVIYVVWSRSRLRWVFFGAAGALPRPTQLGFLGRIFHDGRLISPTTIVQKPTGRTYLRRTGKSACSPEENPPQPRSTGHQASGVHV